MSGFTSTTIYGWNYVTPTAALPLGSAPVGSEMPTGGAGSPYTGANILRLVQYNPAGVGGSLAIGGAVKMISTDVVDGTSAVTESAIGFNDVSGAVVPIGSYFWMNRHGFCKPLVAAGIAAGVNPGCTATFATLGAAQAGLNKNITLLAASGAGGQTNAYKD